jgi:hypothetical protein
MGESEQKSKHLNQHERERGRGDGRQHDTYHPLIEVKVTVRRKYFRRYFALQIYFGLGVKLTDFRRNAKKQAKTQKFNDGIKLYSYRSEFSSIRSCKMKANAMPKKNGGQSLRF